MGKLPGILRTVDHIGNNKPVTAWEVGAPGFKTWYDGISSSVPPYECPEFRLITFTNF